MKNLSPKHRKILMWTMVAVCAVIYAAVDLQDPVQIHPEVKGWKTLKIGMPISEARNELRKYCKDLEHPTSTEPTGYECGYFKGHELTINLMSSNKYLFWNFLEHITLGYDGMDYSHYDMFFKQLERKYGPPVSDYRDCKNNKKADCSAMFADRSVWLMKDSYKNWTNVSISYTRAWN